MKQKSHGAELTPGRPTKDLRFRFGANWERFTQSLTEQQIQNAMNSLHALVGDLHGKAFLDVGCGSGIHSLAAARLGAARIHSFDFDKASVSCTRHLKETFAPNSNWLVESGSALDRSYLKRLGQFSIVYSWGVLHHTGDLWTALDAITAPVDGLLAISIYNDQGWISNFWRALKKQYNRSGRIGRKGLEILTFGLTWGKHFLRHPVQAPRNWRNYSKTRGMSPWTDVVDWAGGYPFEVAKPQQVVSFFEERGFALVHSNSCRRGHGCNEFIFRRRH